MSISAPLFRQNCGAEIGILVTSTSFRHFFDTSFLTGWCMQCTGKGYLLQLELSDPMDAAANGFLTGTPHLMEPVADRTHVGRISQFHWNCLKIQEFSFQHF